MYISLDIAKLSDCISILHREKIETNKIKESLELVIQEAFEMNDYKTYQYQKCLDEINQVDRRIDNRIAFLEEVIADFSKIKNEVGDYLDEAISLIDSVEE